MTGERTSFDRLFLGFLAERERTMGSEPGGLHGFYSRRLQRGCAFNDNEEAAIRSLVDELPRYEAYVEIGAGLGQLACWLAVAGLKSVAIERDHSRFAGIEALKAAAARQWPWVAINFAAISGAFPCPVSGVEPTRSLVLATNLVHGASYDAEQRIIDGMATYSAALVDSVRFCRDRFDEDEWRALDERFAAAGLSEHRVVWPNEGHAGAAAERIVWYRRRAG